MPVRAILHQHAPPALFQNFDQFSHSIWNSICLLLKQPKFMGKYVVNQTEITTTLSLFLTINTAIINQMILIPKRDLVLFPFPVLDKDNKFQLHHHEFSKHTEDSCPGHQATSSFSGRRRYLSDRDETPNCTAGLLQEKIINFNATEAVICIII